MVYICTATCGDLLANGHFKSEGSSIIAGLQVQFMLADLQLLSVLFEVCSSTATRYFNHVLLATLVEINDYKAQSNCNQDPTFRHSSLVSSLGVIYSCNRGFLNTQGMTSPANEMHVFLWQIGTVIPIQSLITHIYMPRF